LSFTRLHFSIITDTLLSVFLPAYRFQAKVREVAHPKFYWFEPGVARAAGLPYDSARPALAGGTGKTDHAGKRSYAFNGIEILPVKRFLERLHAGEVF
jgi:hypothetical protein